MAAPEAHISKMLAHQRIKIFTDFKNLGLKDITGNLETDQISYDPNSFKQLLEELTANSNWDGIRVYFANYKKNPNDPIGNSYIPRGQNKKFTLIFVPTEKGTSDVHNDIISQCRIIDKNDHVQILNSDSTSGDSDTASRWIEEYQKNKLPSFIKDGENETEMPSFSETKCIWYDKKLIERRSDGKGILNYIDDLGNKLEEVIIFIAGYLSGETFREQTKLLPCQYQLTLIFYFHDESDLKKISKNTNLFFSFAYKDFSEDFKKEFTMSTDTGNPCPPPNSGCKGSKLGS